MHNRSSVMSRFRKSWVASLVALAWLLTVPTDAGNLINPYRFNTNLPIITFVGCVSSTADLTTYTFSATPTGTAAADRFTFVASIGEDTADTFDTSTITLDGVSMLERIDQRGIVNGGTNSSTAMYVLKNTTGTTASFVVTWSEPITAAAICVWAGNMVDTTLIVDTAADGDPDAALLTLSMEVNAFGVVIAGCGQSDPASTHTWVGATERVDTLTAEGAYSAADFTQGDTGQLLRTITSDSTGTGQSSCVAMSLR